jgi:hypothetical protein
MFGARGKYKGNVATLRKAPEEDSQSKVAVILQGVFSEVLPKSSLAFLAQQY